MKKGKQPLELYGLLFIAIALLLPSCRFQRARRYVNASQAANIVYLTKKGDAKITGYYSGDGSKKNDGCNIQGAFALTNHVAIMGSFTFKRESNYYHYDTVLFHRNDSASIVQTNLFDSSLLKYHRKTFEAGIGYFTQLNRLRARGKIMFNAYVGVALGNSTLDDSGLDSNSKPYSRYYNFNNTKWFAQFGFNFMPSPYFYASVGGKLSLFHFGTPSTSYTAAEMNYFYLDKVKKQNFFLWEPYANLQFGLPGCPWLKVDAQLSLTPNFGNDYPKVHTFNGSIGLTMEVPNAFPKHK
ncbi:hypothetical protein [Parasediminibacterium sp. JCM 36343]|uniref:hypothetical protein n=1 Tax=Parasediminibacterium sp. JCM 36343 TaxID=3374279 RepID=UPI00397ADD0A